MMILEQRGQDRWMQTLLTFVKTRNLIQSGDKVLVCCSGGLDSTVLTHLLARVADMLDIDVEAVHVDHRTRGESSFQEGVWVQVLCDRLGIKLHRMGIERLKSKGQLELREARMALVEELVEENSFTKIVTAHHADDNAETLFMRMISGSGITGLKGILPKRGKWIRPLLTFSKEELSDYAKQYRLGWVEDPSNARSDYLRNQVRNEILPKIEEVRKSSLKNLSRLAERVEEEESEWEEWVDNELKSQAAATLSLGWLEKWPVALQRRVLRGWLKVQGFENVPAWIEILLKKKDFLTPSGSFLFRSDSLIFSPEGEFGSLWSTGMGPLENDKRYDLGNSRAWNFLPQQHDRDSFLSFSMMLQFKAPTFQSEGLIRLNWEALPWPLSVRSAQKGDDQQWLESELAAAKIPRAYWRSWPLLVGGKSQEIVGLLGVSYREKYLHTGLKRCVCIHAFFEQHLSPTSQS